MVNYNALFNSDNITCKIWRAVRSEFPDMEIYDVCKEVKRREIEMGFEWKGIAPPEVRHKELKQIFQDSIESAIKQNAPFGFDVIAQNKRAYHNLFDYFTYQVGTELNFKKGLIVIGNVGTGKTTLMNIFADFVGNTLTDTDYLKKRNLFFQIITARDIDRNVSKGNIKYYESLIDKRLNLCIDDLGLERRETNSYGNKNNIIEDLILDRYELWHKHGIKTHYTTNLNLDAIKRIYSERTFSRLTQMTNAIIWQGSDFRKKNIDNPNASESVKRI